MSQQQSTSNTNRKQRVTSVNQRIVVTGFVIVAMLALVVFAVRIGSRATTIDVTRADPTNAQLVATGKQLYTTRCAGCHGRELQGEVGWPQRRANGTVPATPLDDTGATWQRNDRWIFDTIKHGGQATTTAGTTSTMPAMGEGLADAEIWAIISYIKQSWPANIQAAQPVQ